MQHFQSSIRVRLPGMGAMYICKKCGGWFWARIPIFGFFGLEQPKCPDCGSRRTDLDNRVVY